MKRLAAHALLLLAAAAAPIALAALVARAELAPDGVATDDAYIVLRYARNLAAGHGWVWNPGGEAVEGTTSTLWTLLATLATRCAADPRDLLFALAIAAVAAALAALSATALGAGRAGGAAAAAALGFWCSARPSFAIWTAASLMDSGIWCASLLATAATLVRLARAPHSRAAVAAAVTAQVALALARPESLLVAPLALAVAALFGAPPLRVWLAPALGAGLAQLGLLAFRLASFGWPLPNTYYAKVGSDPGERLAAGVAWLARSAREDPSLLPGLVLAVGALIWLPRLRAGSRESACAIAIAASWTLAAPLAAVWEGGDYFPGTRPLEPFRPFVGLLALLIARRWLAARLGPERALATGTALLALAALATYQGGSARWGSLARTTRHAVDFETARAGLASAQQLDRAFPADRTAPRVGVLAAGAFPWAWRGASRDLLGLNDTAMAHATGRRAGLHGHSAFVAEALFADPPELLLIGPRQCTGLRAERAARRLAFRVALADLDRDPRFVAAYRLVHWLPAAAGGSTPLCTFARRDWLAAGADGGRWRAAEDGSAAPP